MKGRKKTVEQHKQDGTFRKDRHLPDLIQAGRHSDAVEVYPDDLPPEASKYWYLIVANMKIAKSLNDEDLAMIRSLVMCYHLQDQCFKNISENGLQLILTNSKGAEYVQRNPAIESLDAVQKRIILFSKHLGLSPLARTDIGVSKSDKKDPLLDLI